MKYIVTEEQLNKAIKHLMTENSNLPPGTSDNDRNAPWNDPDYDIIDIAYNEGAETLDLKIMSTQSGKRQELHSTVPFYEIEDMGVSPIEVYDSYKKTGHLPDAILKYALENAEPYVDDTDFSSSDVE